MSESDMAQGAKHVALLGDSVFDNRRYTQGEPDVVGHLKTLLPAPWTATLLARDGSGTSQLPGQLARVSAGASHLVVSVGGNDLLMLSRFLPAQVTSTMEALRLFGNRVEAFDREYRQALREVLALKREVTVCTVYGGNFARPQGEFARAAVSLFDDAILRFAFEHGLRVIELRSVCTEPADFANALEPSGSGGAKIAKVISQAIGAVAPPLSPGVAQVFVAH